MDKENEMERRDVVLAHWLEFQNGNDTNAHIRSFERAWDFSARIRVGGQSAVQVDSGFRNAQGATWSTGSGAGGS